MQTRRVNTFKDVQEHFYRTSTHAIAHSICVILIALNEEFGFGAERLGRLVERYYKINRSLNAYQDEAKSDAEIRRRVAELGLQEFADHIMATHDIKKYRQEVKQMNQVSVKEAAEMQKALQMMKGLM